MKPILTLLLFVTVSAFAAAPVQAPENPKLLRLAESLETSADLADLYDTFIFPESDYFAGMRDAFRSAAYRARLEADKGN